MWQSIPDTATFSLTLATGAGEITADGSDRHAFRSWGMLGGFPSSLLNGLEKGFH
jgi:hypothetical protein